MMNFKQITRHNGWKNLEPITDSEGRLYNDWAELFEAMPERFMVGSDMKFGRVFPLSRAQEYDATQSTNHNHITPAFSETGHETRRSGSDDPTASAGHDTAPSALRQDQAKVFLYDVRIKAIREILGSINPDAAELIAYKNAEIFFR
tara:strand:+ start:43 stop:483 length:441 start_codon:yes stop_codon:yes gene_type:complete